jgi:urease accessory protein
MNKLLHTSTPPAAGWHAHLNLDYERADQRTILRFSHDGPLRVLKSLYPEGEGVCHSVLVHPPGGLVAGDVLDIRVRVQAQAHALISTPGATRFYAAKSATRATQRIHLQVETGARLEWLPLETLAYPGCRADNALHFELAPAAELLGWDVLALGLPATNTIFDHGDVHQCLHWPGHWREEGRLDASNQRLMNSPLGLAGRRCLGTLWLASGTAMSHSQREALLHSLRTFAAQHPLGTHTGITCPTPQMLVVRVLADMVEPVHDLLRHLWAILRREHWDMSATPPRIWSV